MQRILVIGSPGAGKSTFARQLSQRTGLPLIHLDQHYWRSGWVETPKPEWQSKVAQLIAGDRWIIDGNYGGTLELRLTRADTVIDLQLAGWLCIARLLRRIIQARGRTRADMAEGCPERIDLSFLWWTLKYPYSSLRRIDRKLAQFRGRRVTLTDRSQVQSFFASLADQPPRDGI